MEASFQQEFEIQDICVDRYGRLKPSAILYFAQEVAGRHCDALSLDYDTLASRRLFWAVTRHRVQITRLPERGETVRVETWPMPTTRVAFPRSIVVYDAAGNECCRSISLWVLMNLDTRNMILPGKSGIAVSGTLRGTELALPGSLVPRLMDNSRLREVRFTDLDRNGHMNNSRYMDWIDDLLPSAFHEKHPVKEFTVCYHSEAREGQTLDLRWDFAEDGCLRVDAYRKDEEKDALVFSARVLFD